MTHISIRSGRLFVFMDASNLWAVQKSKGKLFDFEKLKEFLKTYFEASCITCCYYSAYPADGTREYSLEKRHNFFVFLKKALGFLVRKKALKRIKVETSKGTEIQEKGNMDVELTIDALHYMKNFDTAVIFTGDSDFLELILYLQRANKRVIVFSSKKNVAVELSQVADEYFDILDITENIWRKDIVKAGEIENTSGEEGVFSGK